MESGTPRLISLRLADADDTKLRKQADSLGLKPAVFARLLIRVGLNQPQLGGKRHSRKQVESAFKRLERLAASGDVAPFDAAEVIRRMREEREEHLIRLVRPNMGHR